MIMANTKSPRDPDWGKVSASLRKGVLYVKLPRAKLFLLTWGLMKIKEDLASKDIQETEYSFFISGTAEEWAKDQEAIAASLEKNRALLLPGPLLILLEFCKVIRRGLANDPKVDWISRVSSSSTSGSTF